MIDLPSIESIKAALNQPLVESLRRLLEDRLTDARRGTVQVGTECRSRNHTF